LDRLLDAPAGRPQQVADVIEVIVHAELAADDRRHPLGGPDIPTEAERLGALCQELGQLPPLLVG
jgi:hypothetical protein